MRFLSSDRAADGITAEVTFDVVRVTGLLVEVFPYPQRNINFQNPNLLESIMCTNVPQRAHMSVLGEASDGSRAEIKDNLTIQSSNPAIVTYQSGVVVPEALGSASFNVRFGLLVVTSSVFQVGLSVYCFLCEIFLRAVLIGP